LSHKNKKESVHTHTLSIEREALHAINRHKPFNSLHEAYAVILEELDELWDEIKKVKSTSERTTRIRSEAIQTAAMCLRLLVDFY